MMIIMIIIEMNDKTDINDDNHDGNKFIIISCTIFIMTLITASWKRILT